MHRIEKVDFRGNPIENEQNYALKMWKALPSLSVLDSRRQFTDGPSFAAVKISGKHEETKTRLVMTGSCSGALLHHEIIPN